MSERDAISYVKRQQKGNKQDLKVVIGPELYQKLRSADIIAADDNNWYLTNYGREYNFA